MKTALADYLAQEALLSGAIPVIKATMLPYLWPNGVNGDGEMDQTSFQPGPPPKIAVDYHGFTYGYWLSPIIESDMQDASTDSILSWIGNSPGYDSGDLIIYRTGNTAAEVLTAAWSPISNGGSIPIAPFYQLGWELYGYKAWAADDILAALNGGVELWSAGGAAAPDSWTFWQAGTGGSVAREGTTKQHGAYSAKLICGTDVTMLAIQFANYQDYRGQTLNLCGWVKASVAGKVSLYLGDGVGVAQAFHSGGGAWEFLTCPLTVDPSATKLEVELRLETGGGTAYFDNLSLEPEMLAPSFTAWAEDTEGTEGYAASENVPGDPYTYIKEVKLTGEFAIIKDIEQAGGITQEMPKAFDDLVAGSHSGLVLSNRQSTLVGTVVTQAPRYSPNKATFFMQGQDWFGTKLKMEMGWNLSGWMVQPIEDGPFLAPLYTSFLPLFLGKVTKWGPVSRSVDAGGLAAPHTVEIFAKDLILDCLDKRVALPADDGSPNPLTFGEFLLKAEAVSGWSPEPIFKAAYFEDGTFNELSHVIAGGGAFRIVSPGLAGVNAFQVETTGANQTPYGSIAKSSAGELFVSGLMRIVAAPASPADQNTTLLQIINAAGASIYSITVDSTGALYSSLGGQSKFNISAYIGVPLPFVLWYAPTNPGHARLWINGDEVLAHVADLSAATPIEFRFGAQTGATPENWMVDFDSIEVRTKYLNDAFVVTGAPFSSIGPVYIDNVSQPDSKTVGGYAQTLARFPQYGMVQLASADPEFKPSGEVMMRVVASPAVDNAGGMHALKVIENLLAAAGLTAYIDTASLAAAYAACPNDIINARFDGGGERQSIGLNDRASMGATVSDCIKEVCSRMLYWVFVDAGVIKIVPYLGVTPGTPATPPLDASNLYEATQTIDLDQLNSFVTAIYGWYERNPSLFYIAGVQQAGGQGAGLDYTWGSPVACEVRSVIVAKAELLLKFLSAQERLEPVRTGMVGARFELAESVSVRDELLNDAAENYTITRKDIGLDPGSREVALQLMKFLGE